MGQRQDKFKDLILKAFQEYKHEKLTETEINNSFLFTNVTEVYKKLGGRLSTLPIKYGSWDISTIDFIIELDEERHFNRYRLETLNSNIYKDNKLFSTNAYKQYCTEFEANCLNAAGWGKNWKNNSTEKLFIESGAEKDLTGNGSSRWRQRAYYDFLKDVTAIIRKFPIIRVSIYDVYRNKTIGNLLTNNEDKIMNDFINDIVKEQWR